MDHAPDPLVARQLTAIRFRANGAIECAIVNSLIGVTTILVKPVRTDSCRRRGPAGYNQELPSQ